MSVVDSKSTMVLERSYSSASSTTSSRSRRKRKRIKHTVMPLKKRPGRHEIPCDVHRVSNLDHEDMVQSACFWVAGNPVGAPAERNFKEEIFVNKDEEEFENASSRLMTEIDHRLSRHTEDGTSPLPQNDGSYVEEKTFYGVRKGKMYEQDDLERLSPLPSPRSESRLSSASDDSHSAVSSEGNNGMLVGWTSDITDEESEGERKGGRRPRKDLRSINDKWDESMEYPGNRRREDELDERGRGPGDEKRVVVAHDVSSFETFEDERSPYEMKNDFDDSLDSGSKNSDPPRYGDLREPGPDDRRFHPGKEVRESEHHGYRGRDVEETSEHSSLNGRYVYLGGKPPGDFTGEPDEDRFESSTLESPVFGDDYPEGELLPGVRTSTPNRRELPFSDTEVSAMRSYDADGEQSSNRSLPVYHRKTKTMYYSVEDLRGTTESSEQTTDREPNKSGAPRDAGSREDSVEGTGEMEPTIIATGYELNKPRYVSGPGKEFGEDDKENVRPREDHGGRKGQGETSTSERGYRRNDEKWEESREFYGIRRRQTDDKLSDSQLIDSYGKPITREQHRGDLEPSDGQPGLTRDTSGRDPTANVHGETSGYDTRNNFEDGSNSGHFRPGDVYPGKEVPGSRYPVPNARGVYPGGQNRETVKPGDEEVIKKEDQSGTLMSKPQEEGWEESKEFYGYRRRQTDSKYSDSQFIDSYGKPITHDQHRGNLEPSEGQRGLTRDTSDRQQSAQVDGETSRYDTRMNDSPRDVYPGREVPGREVPGREVRGSKYPVPSARGVYPGGQNEDSVKRGEEKIKKEDQPETLMSTPQEPRTTEKGWEESKEFHGYRRRQTDSKYSDSQLIDSYGKPITHDQHRGNLEPSEGQRGLMRDTNNREPSAQVDEATSEYNTKNNGNYSGQFRPRGVYPAREVLGSKYPVTNTGGVYPGEEIRGGQNEKSLQPGGEEVIKREDQPGTFMSKPQDPTSMEEGREESKEFYGYRRQTDSKYSDSQLIDSYGKPITHDQQRGNLERSEGQRELTRDTNDRQRSAHVDKEISGYHTRMNDSDSGQIRPRDIYPGREVPGPKYPVPNARGVYPGGQNEQSAKPGADENVKREDQPETLMSEPQDHRPIEKGWKESKEFYGYRQRQTDDKSSDSQLIDSNRKPITHDQHLGDPKPSERRQESTRNTNELDPNAQIDRVSSGYDTKDNFEDGSDSGHFRPRDAYPGRELPGSRYPVPNTGGVYPGGQGKENVKPGGDDIIEKEDQPEILMSEPQETNSVEGKWEESSEFYGYRRHQRDEEHSYSPTTASYGKPSARPRDARPSDKERQLGEPMEHTGFAPDHRDDSDVGAKPRYGPENGFEDITDTGPYVPRTYEGIYPGTEARDLAQFVPSDGGVYHGGDLPDEHGRGDEKPVMKRRDREEKPGSMKPRKEGSREPRDYGVASRNNNERAWDLRQRFRESRDPNLVRNKVTSFEGEINRTQMDQSQTEPEYHNSYPQDEPPGDYVPGEEPCDDPQGSHWFVSREIPSAKKVVPVTNSPGSAGQNGGPKTASPGTTETTTKRLHTRSQRDTFRREARRTDTKSADDASDVGMKMFKQRSLPRKHGHPADGSKELPKKVRRAAEPESTKSDPEFRERFRDIAEKRKKAKTRHVAKTTVTTTRTTTKSAEECCSKNVDDLVNVFNTLKNLQKTGAHVDDKGLATKVTPTKVTPTKVTPTKVTPTKVTPRSVRKIVGDTKLGASPGKDGRKLSPATSISQKLQEIENILDSVGKNNLKRSREGSRFKSENDRQSSENGRSTRSSESNNDYSADNSEVDAQGTKKTRITRERHESRKRHESREKHESREEHAWKRDRHEDTPKRPGQAPEIITKQEALPVESYLESTPNESWWNSGGGSLPARFFYPPPFKPFSSNGRGYYDDDHVPSARMSRDDDDDIYRAEIRKARESTWKDRGTRENGGYSRPYSDGEVEGFKSLPFNRVITPGTPVNIRLYGLNLERTCLNTPEGIDWEMLNYCGVPVDEEIARTEIQRRLEIEAMPGDKPRREEAGIGRSVLIPGPSIKWSHSPSSKVLEDETLDEQDGHVSRREIKWSHPPVSKLLPEKLEKSKMPETKSPGGQESTDVPQAIEAAHPPRHTRNVPSEKRPSDERSSEERPLEERPSEEYPSEERPSEEYPSEERPSEERPSEERPSEERPVNQNREIPSDDSEEERSIEIQYIDDELPEGTDPRSEITPMDVSNDLLNEQPRANAGVDTSQDRPEFSERKSEDTSRVTRNKSSSSEQESTTREDHTITTTRTTRTTRTTTETFVKKVKKSASESSRSDDVMETSDVTTASGEPDEKTGSGESDEKTGSGRTSLVAHEYIEMNADTGRPVNVTMLGRIVEDDAVELSSGSREDLFLHTRLKMVTENKRRRSEKLGPSDDAARLRGSETAEQDSDGVDYEGELTDSEEFDDSVPTFSDGVPTISVGTPDDVAEQLLIPISGVKDGVLENVEKMDLDDKHACAFPTQDTAGHDIFSVKAPVDEQITRTTAEIPESAFDDDVLESIFSPRAAHEDEVQKESVAGKEIEHFDSMPEFKEPVSEDGIKASRKKSVNLDVDLGIPEGVEVDHRGLKEKEIVLSQVDERVTAESAPSEEASFPDHDQLVSEKSDDVINEAVSKDIIAPPLLPELQHEPVVENVISEKRDTVFSMPEFLDSEDITSLQPSVVDERISSPQPITRDVCIPQFQEPEARETQSPPLGDENIIPEKATPREEAMPDFQKAMPEFAESRLPSSSISSTEIIDNAPGISEFQEVVPEFVKSRAETNLDDDDVTPLEDDVLQDDFPDFQEAEQEPPRNLIPSGQSDLGVPSSQSLSSESEPFVSIEVIHDTMDTNADRGIDTGDLNRKPKTTEYFEVPKKLPEPETPMDDEVTTEIRSSETITIEKTVRKDIHYVTQVPILQKEVPESPHKLVSFATPLEVKDFSDGISESSSETSLKSSSVGSGDVSSELDGYSPESAPGSAAARRRRNRRGNRFDNLKRSGPLVPESVVSKSTSPEPECMSSEVPGDNVPGITIPMSYVSGNKISEVNIPRIGESTSPAITEKPGRLRPEMYLVSSDDSSAAEEDEQLQAVQVPEKEVWKMDEPRELPQEEDKISAETTAELPEEAPEDERFPKDSDDNTEEEDQLSQAQIDELLEKEIRGLAKESEALVEESDSGVEKETDYSFAVKHGGLAEDREDSETPEEIPTEEKCGENEKPHEEWEKPPEEIEISPDEKMEEVPNEEIPEEIEKAFEEKSEGSSDEEEPETPCKESVEKSHEKSEKFPAEYDSDEGEKYELGKSFEVDTNLLPDEVSLEEPEKSGVGKPAEVYTVPLAQQSAEIPIELCDDVTDKQSTSSEDDVTESPGGVSTREESTVETIIVEKTHSEISTTFTEITTKTFPSDPLVSPKEDGGVVITVEVDSQDDEPGEKITEPADDEPKSDDDEPKSDDDEPKFDDDEPKSDNDYVVIAVEVEKTDGEESVDEVDSSEKQPKLKRASEDESSDSETSQDSEEENLEKVLSACVTSEDQPGDEGPVETVIGILDTKYEKPQSREETMELPTKVDKIRGSSESSDSSVESPNAFPKGFTFSGEVITSQVCEVVSSLPALEPGSLDEPFEVILNSEVVPKSEVISQPEDVPILEDVPKPEVVPISEDVPSPEDVTKSEVMISEEVPISGEAPLLPDEVTEKSLEEPEKLGVGKTAEIYTVPLAQRSAEIPIELCDDVTDKQSTSSEDDVTGGRGGVSTRESTVETIIVEKTHSEVTTTFTEITTKTFPSDPLVSPKEDGGVVITVEVDSQDDEPGEKVTVPDDDEPKSDDDEPRSDDDEPKSDDDEPKSDDDEPKSDDDYVVIPVEVDSSEKQPKLKRASEDESSDSETSQDSEEEKVLSACVTSEDQPGDEGPVETVIGILDIKYEKPQSREDTMELPTKVDKIRGSSESSDSSVESPNVFPKGFTFSGEVITSQVCEVVSSLPALERSSLDEPSEVVPKSEVLSEPEDVPILGDVPKPEDVSICEDVPSPEDVTKPEVMISEEVPTPGEAPLSEHVWTLEVVPISEDVPKPEEVPIPEDDLDLAIILKEKESDESEFDVWGSGAQHIHTQTKESESQTENDTFSETTQTEETTKTTRESSSMTRESDSVTESSFKSVGVFEEHQTQTPQSIVTDSDMQTDVELCDGTSQTDLESNSDVHSKWFSYEKTVEVSTESSEQSSTRKSRGKCNDNQTQTDIGVDDFGSQTYPYRTTESGSMTDDDFRGAATNDDGTQTDNRVEGSWNEDGVTRTVRRTTEETRSYHEHVETVCQDGDLKSDCPVCLQSLEGTLFSFIRVSDPSRFVGLQDFACQTDIEENGAETEPVLCCSCGGRRETREHRETRAAEDHRDTEEHWETREHEDTREHRETREHQETWGHSRTVVDEWEHESSPATSGEAHLAIHILGDEKCSLFCRRVGNHTCMLQKLASIIQANRRATTADQQGATTSTQDQGSETSESLDPSREAPESGEEQGDAWESGSSDGGKRCDVSVQTDGAILPTDFEVFSEKDFEIYYDKESSPWFV